MIYITQKLFDPPSKSLQVVRFECDGDVASIFLNNINLLQAPADEMFELFRAHSEPPSLVNSPQPGERALFQQIPISYGSAPAAIMIRTLALLHRGLRLPEISGIIREQRPIYRTELRQAISDRITFDQENWLFDEFAIENTGNTGRQPSVYFVPKNLIHSNKNALRSLFHQGFLARLFANITHRTSSYYTPFSVPSTSSLGVHLTRTLREIFHLHELRIKRFIDGHR